MSDWAMSDWTWLDGRVPDSTEEPVTSQGLPKDERIRKSDDFTRILRGGKRVRGSALDVRWCTDGPETGSPNRIGVAVGRRLGKAVLRNRLKRRIREAYRRNKGELPCRGISMIILATPQLAERSAPQVEDEMRRLLRELAASSAGA